MEKYRVYKKYVEYYYLDIEAETEKQAEEIGEEIDLGEFNLEDSYLEDSYAEKIENH